MLGCRFRFGACAKNVQEKATKCSLKTTEVLLDADGHVFYQGTVAPNCFKSYKLLVSWFFRKKKFCLMSGLKFNLSDVTSFIPDNLCGLKKIIFKLDWENLVRLSENSTTALLYDVCDKNILITARSFADTDSVMKL